MFSILWRDFLFDSSKLTLNPSCFGSIIVAKNNLIFWQDAKIVPDEIKETGAKLKELAAKRYKSVIDAVGEELLGNWFQEHTLSVTMYLTWRI